MDTTAGVLIVSGVAGLAAMASLVVVRRSLPGPGDGGGSGTPPPRPTTVRPAADPDAALLRLLDDPRLSDLAIAHRSPFHGRRAGRPASGHG
jgi:hypothetical protein